LSNLIIGQKNSFLYSFNPLSLTNQCQRNHICGHICSKIQQVSDNISRFVFVEV